MLAKVLERQDRYADAIKEYETILRRHPNFGDAHYYIGEIKAYEGKDQAALDAYRQALEADGRHERALNAFIRMSRRMDKSTEGQIFLEKLIEADTENAVAILGLLDWYKDIGEAAASIPYFENFYARNRDGFVPRRALMVAYENANRYDSVIRMYREDLERFPEDMATRETLAQYLNRWSRFDQALKEYEILLEQSPKNARYMYGMALVHERNGDIKKAIEIFEELVQIEPGNEHFEESLNRLKGGESIEADEDELPSHLPIPESPETDAALSETPPSEQEETDE